MPRNKRPLVVDARGNIREAYTESYTQKPIPPKSPIKRAPSETPPNPYKGSRGSAFRKKAKGLKTKGLSTQGLIMEFISAPAAKQASENKGIQPKWRPGIKPKGYERKV